MDLRPYFYRWLAKLAGKPDKAFNTVTEADIYYCYRLFLHRTPSKKDIQHWMNIVRTHKTSLKYITDSFLYSDELKMLQMAAGEPKEVALPHYKLFVRLNDYFIGRHIYHLKEYEPYITAFLEDNLKPGMTFLDIGANIGYFSCQAAHLVGPTGQVIAFEPVPNNCALLRMSIAANQFENITLYQNAVAQEKQQFALEMGGQNSNSRIKETADFPDSIIVEAVSLDETIGDLEQLDYLKIDIEGAEPLAFAGMTQLIKRLKPIIILEFSPDLIRLTAQSDPLAFLNQLTNWGYQFQILDQSYKKDAPYLSPQKIISQSGPLTNQDHLDLLLTPV